MLKKILKRQLLKMKDICYVFLFTVLTGVLQSCETDVSHMPFASEVYGKRFVLEEDSFLFRWSDTQEYDISVPGKFNGNSGLPVSVEDYELHPNDWGKTEAYLALHRDTYFTLNNVVGILRKGTIVKVTKLVKIETIDDGRIKIDVEIEDGPYKGLVSGISLIRYYGSQYKFKWIRAVE